MIKNFSLITHAKNHASHNIFSVIACMHLGNLICAKAVFFIRSWCVFWHKMKRVCAIWGRGDGWGTLGGRCTRIGAAGRSRTRRTAASMVGETMSSWSGGGSRRGASWRGLMHGSFWGLFAGRSSLLLVTPSLGTRWSLSFVSCLRYTQLSCFFFFLNLLLSFIIWLNIEKSKNY